MNPYAAPREHAVAVTDAPEPGRVGGFMRLLASIIDFAIVAVIIFVVAPEAYRASGVTRAASVVHVVTTALWITTEITLAATPAMLLLRLRVARADGATPTRGLLVAKAIAVRVPQLLSFHETIAIAFGITAASTAKDTILPKTPIAWIEFVLGIVWAIGYLLAFGKRRQTHIDRALGLAVFRRARTTTA